MALTGTTTELLAAIRQDARLADDDPEATDAILLAEATRVLHRTYVPAVRKCRSDYYVTTARIALEASRGAYPIPRRATTSTVRRVRVLDSSGRPVVQLSPSSIEDFGAGTSSVPTAYAITDSQLVVYPTPTGATHTLEVMFEYRPSQLIVVANARAIETYDYDTAASEHQFTITALTGLDDGEKIDVVRADPPFSTPLMDGVADVSLAGAAVDVAFTAYVGSLGNLGVQAGDYLCFAGESPIPQIPIELHPCLAMHTAAKFLTPIDPQGAAQLQANADADMVAVLEAMTPRQQGAQQRMRPRVRHVRTGGGGYRRGGSTFGDLS